MSDDPGVRSVRVALALCDRFVELLKGPSKVTARKQSGALFGVSGNEESLSLRIGEAQQLYPEIWRHLDDARDAFVARGVDVATYDAVRASEGLAIGAAVDIKHAHYGAGRYAVDETVKSANFNREGAHRAREAADALMHATPEIDWAAIARAEAEDPAVAAFTRATRRKRWIRFALLGAVLALPFAWVIHQRRAHDAAVAAWSSPQREPEPDPQQLARERAELATQVGEIRGMLAKARAGWTTLVAGPALAAVEPSARRCPEGIEIPTPVPRYPAGMPIPDDQLATTSAALEGIAKRLAAGEALPELRRELFALSAYVVFVTSDRAGGSELVGRGYVVAMRDARILCVGDVAVHGAKDDRDLDARLHEAVTSALRRAD